ncbi:uncharacterized protein LOC124359693 [Homalodisca vitripennis]|uniref:uncharacterized protein LOC124359693 n=1 Tax=Homalodisca vitripennis TaxID=197043 RepID=UPI001EEA0476|nr:uncharacterized protein LOC124359693 [Homalodisca vitripennis]
MSRVQWCWCVVTMLLISAALARCDDIHLDNNHLHSDNDEYLLKQVVWKRCYRNLSTPCLKLSLVRTIEMMSKDSAFFLLPGVFFSSNNTDPLTLPPEVARSLSSDKAPLDDVVAFTLKKYVRSITLNVNLIDFMSGGNGTFQKAMVDVFSGRAKKDGLGGYGAVAAMMGGMMASVMMAALAALAGKALMTSLLALMMAGFSAVRGGGGGGGGGDTKTYEVITKPVVSHINTHTSEVQHEHGHWHKRSLDPWGPWESLRDWRGDINNIERSVKIQSPKKSPRTKEK